MNRTKYSIFALTAVVCLCIFGCMSCNKDEDSPSIESVWRNIQNEPIERIERAYPGQTLCLHGAGFGNLQKLIVNGTEIEVLNNLIYDTDSRITFQLPANVNTSTDAAHYYIKVITGKGEAIYQPFQVKLQLDKPSITKFSATTLTAGSKLTITGTNLDGATDVFLPVANGGKVKCEFDTSAPNTKTTVNVIVPANAHFAKGQMEIVMLKTDDIMGTSYEERVFSSITNFQ